jgi:hypothetical protein
MTYENDARFNFIDEDGNTWFCKKDDDYKPSKEKFIEERFVVKYGRELSYKMITSLVSRSSALRDWYATQLEDFILEVEVPKYYEEILTPKEYKNLAIEVSKVNKNFALESNELNEISKKYKADCEKIRKDYKIKNDKLFANKLVKILTLNSESLPIGLQLKLENYTPSDQDDIRTSALYGRELLVRYKISLMEAFKNGADIDAMIANDSEKF